MKFLQRLIRFVTSSRLTNNRNFTHLLNKEDNKLAKLYTSLLRGAESDAQCAREVYGTEWEKFETKYRVLKTRLQNKVLDATLHIDFKSRKLSSRALAQYQCMKLMYQMNVLNGLYTSSVGIVLANRMNSLAEKYSLTEYRLHAHIALLNYHSLNSHILKFMEIRKKEQLLREIWSAEQETLACLQEFYMLGSAKLFLNDSEKERLKKYVTQAKNTFEKYNTPDLARYYFSLERIYSEACYDFDKTINICRKAISYFETNSIFNTRQNKGVFIISQMAAYICKNQVDDFMYMRQKANAIYKIGATNWFYLKQTEFQCLMRAQKYADAVNVFNETVGHERFELQSKPLKEKFLLFEFYLRFFIAKREYFKSYFSVDELPDLKVTLYPSRLRRKKNPLMLRDFVQYLPTLCKDDKGYLAPVSLALMLYSLTEDDIENAIICENSLHTFCRRRMNRNQPGYRTGCLINMVHQFVEAGLDIHKTRALTLKWQRKMSNSVNTIDFNFDMEIIPYEHWWEMLLSTQVKGNVDVIRKRLERRRSTIQKIGGKMEYAPLSGLRWKNNNRSRTKPIDKGEFTY